MSQLPTRDQTKDFENHLIKFYHENCSMLVRIFSRMGEKSEIQSVLHLILAEIFDRYLRGEPAPENLGGFVRVAIERKLIDLIRREVDQVPVEDLDNASVSQSLDLPLTPQLDETAWKELLRIVFDRLPPRWHEAAEMAMLGASPAEIGEKFGHDGYVLRRHVRHLICRILGDLAAAGDELARGLVRDFCPEPRRAAQASNRASAASASLPE
jgi:DNA-directed RNA polymerase specialized sigma24 family protein